MKSRTFRVLYTSDIHGRLFATPGEPGLDEMGPDFSGDGNTLILDGGDLLQGGPAGAFLARRGHLSDSAEISPAARVLNLQGYHAVVPGNHDFNYGIDYLARYLRGLNAVCLCANIRDKAGILPIRDCCVFTLENGLRIGVFGLCTDALRGWERQETLEKLVIAPPLEAGRGVISHLRQRCDVTVCVYHGGFETNPVTGSGGDDSGENIACAISRELAPDLLLTGHQHLCIPGRTMGHSFTLQPGAFCRHYGDITGTVSHDGRVSFSSRLVPVAPPRSPADPTGMGALLARWMAEPVCTLPAPLPLGDRVEAALRGSQLADLINRVQLSVTGADVSATCLSNTAVGLPQTVLVGDVFRAYTSANTLCVLRCTGQVLRQALEWTACFLEPDEHGFHIAPRFLSPKPRYFHYDFYAGIDYQLDFTRPQGSRVLFLRRQGRDIDPEDAFSLCITNYRRAGGDGYHMFRSCPLLFADETPMAEHLLSWLRENGGKTQGNEEKQLQKFKSAVSSQYP